MPAIAVDDVMQFTDTNFFIPTTVAVIPIIEYTTAGSCCYLHKFNVV